MDPTNEVPIPLTVIEWNQIRAVLGEQVAAFQAQVERNNATIKKINDGLWTQFEAVPRPGPQLVS